MINQLFKRGGSGKVRRNQLIAAATVFVIAGGLLVVTSDVASAHRRGGDRWRSFRSSQVSTTTTVNRSAPTTTALRDGGAAAPTTTIRPAALDVITRDCDDSRLQTHDGFQTGNKCVETEFGEVSAAANNPSLLITDSPNQVRVGQTFNITVSTRNLIRDRFLAAAAGGYYLEASVLRDGLQRGHIHTGCRMLTSTNSAPDPAPVPAFFKATEDGQGGRGANTVTIAVSGMPTAGLAQCAVWAGDGSHRIPMMERANQTPAFDAVRIRVTQ